MIQSVLGRFTNPPTHANDPPPLLVQGPINKSWCQVGMSWCDDDCDHCLPWLASCETCDEHGHQCGDWVVHEVVAGSGSVVTYCPGCAHELGIDANI